MGVTISKKMVTPFSFEGIIFKNAYNDGSAEKNMGIV